MLQRVINQSRTSSVRTDGIVLAEKVHPDGVSNSHEGERRVSVQTFHTHWIPLPGDSD
jgi:hypothetical protein